MNKRQAAEYYLSNPDLLVKYVCYNNPQGVVDLLEDHFPEEMTTDGFNTEKEIYLFCRKIMAKQNNQKDFAKQLAASVAKRNPQNTWANIDEYAS